MALVLCWPAFWFYWYVPTAYDDSICLWIGASCAWLVQTLYREIRGGRAVGKIDTARGLLLGEKYDVVMHPKKVHLCIGVGIGGNENQSVVFDQPEPPLLNGRYRNTRDGLIRESD